MELWPGAFHTLSLARITLLPVPSKFPQIDTGYIIHSLTNFEDAEKEQGPVELIPEKWEEIKKELQKAVIDFTVSSG